MATALKTKPLGKGDAEVEEDLPRPVPRPVPASPRPNKGRLLLVLPVLLLVGAAALWLGAYDAVLDRLGLGEPPPPVVLPIAPRPVVALGRLLPRGDVVRVAAPSGAGAARIARLFVEEGDEVRAGDTLAVLDNAERLEAAHEAARAEVNVKAAARARVENEVQASRAAAEAALHSAEAAAATAQAERERAEALFERNALARSALDQRVLAADQAARAVEEARAALVRWQARNGEQPDVALAREEWTAARARADLARADLAASAVQASTGGMILDVHARPGERIGEAGLLDMGDVAAMMARIEVYETDIARVALGDPVTMTAAPFGEPLHGRVRRVGHQVGRQTVVEADPSASTDARVVEVWAALDGPSTKRARGFTNLQVTARVGERP